MKKSNLKKKSLLEIDGIKLTRNSFPYTDFNGKSHKIRYYEINFYDLFIKNIRQFLGPVKKQLKFNDFQISMYYAYLRLHLYLTRNINNPAGKKPFSPIINKYSKRRRRAFTLSTLFFHKIFNPSYDGTKTIDPQKLKKMSFGIRDKLSKGYSKQILDNFENDMQFKYDMANAMFIELPSNKLTLGLHGAYILELIEKISNWEMIGISDTWEFSKETEEFLNQELAEDLPFESLIPEEKKIFYDLIAELNKFLTEIADELLSIKKIDHLKPDDLFIRKKSIEALVMEKPEIIIRADSILSLLREKCESKIIATRSEINPQWYKNIIVEIDYILLLDPIKKISSLPGLHFKLSDKSSFFQSLIVQLDKIVRVMVSSFSKQLLVKLDKIDILSKAEKRLFICQYIGTPGLYYKIPFLEPILFDFFKFYGINIFCFIESVLLKNKSKYGDVLKFYLKYSFWIYLKFYAFWEQAIKEDESVKKAENQFYKQNVLIFENEEDIFADINDDILPSLYKDEEKEEEKDKETDEDKGEKRKEINVRPKKIIFKFKDEKRIDYDFQNLDILRKYLTEGEAGLIEDLYYRNYTIQQIAERDNSSVSEIETRVSNIIKELIERHLDRKIIYY